VRRAATVVIAALLLVASCGGEDRGVTARAARELGAKVDAIRFAAAGKDRDGAAHQLALLRTTVEELERDGALTESAATRIRAAAGEVETRLTLIPTTTTTTTTTTTLPPPEDEHGKGKGKDRGERGHQDD
jgi:hypothetical protein